MKNATTQGADVLYGLAKDLGQNSMTDYLVALGIALGGILVITAFRGFLSRRLHSWMEQKGGHGRIDRALVARMINSVFWLLMIMPPAWALSSLTFSKGLTGLIRFIFLLLYTFGAARFCSRLLGFLLDAFLRRDEQGAGAKALMPIVSTVVWAIAITFVLDNLGFQISSIVAGLGIMGVAVGLAGQAILADFFSYLVILMDRPFAIGDNVTFGSTTGTIERIGIKTTRVRAASGELIIVPNADMTKQTLSNFKPVRNRTKVFSFGILYETPLEKVKAVPDMVRDVAAGITGMKINRVHFTTFADSSLHFDVSFTMPVSDLPSLLDGQQALNLGIMEKFEAEGIGFAYPTTTLYMANAAKHEEVVGEG